MLLFISSTPVGSRILREHARGLRMLSKSSITNCSVNPAVPTVSRRKALQLAGAFAAAAAFLPNSFSLAETTSSEKLGEVVRDELHGFEYRPPSEGWSKQTATISSARVATVYVRDADGDTNVNVVTTSVSSDYQVLTSFGGMDKVVSTLVPPKRKDVEGSLIESRTDDNNKAYLITLTAQAREENWPEVEPVVRAVIDSYKLKVLD